MAKYDFLKDNIAPGEKISALKQCQKAFGPKFKPHLSQNEEPFEVLKISSQIGRFRLIMNGNAFQDLCRELWCANSSHALRAHPALEGTDCSAEPYPYGSVSCLGNIDLWWFLAVWC